MVVTSALFVALTCAMTYPQVLHLADRVHDEGDPLLNAWAMAWVAHQLPRAPAHLFDANIFYPERRTLAYSETLLLPSLVAAPLHWAGVGPILVYNLVFLSGFALSGVGMALLVRSLTGRDAAGIVAGIVFAFLPYRIDHYAHLQLQQTQCLPFAMWAFHRMMRSGAVRDGVLFGAFVAGQILSCMYYGLLQVPYLTVVCGTLAIAAWARDDAEATATSSADRLSRWGRAALPVAVAALVVVAVAAPVGKAYLGARKVVGERGRDEIVQGSARLTDYLGPPEENIVYGQRLSRFARGERRLFPGFVAIGLALVGVLGVRRRWRAPGVERVAIVAYALGLLVAIDLSLGFNGLSFPVLYDHALPFRGLRIPARTGIIAGFSLAVLAGFGAAHIRNRRWLTVVAALLLVEYASWHIPMITMPTTAPSVYADILRDNAGNPDAALFEFPVSSHDDPTYMYYATFHWQHLVNGYSGFFPPSYVFLVNAVENIPDSGSLHAIKSHGARYLLVHGERLLGSRYDELTAELRGRPELTFVANGPAERDGQHGEISVFRVSYAESR